MEYFSIIEVSTTEQTIQEKCTLHNLEALSNEFISLSVPSADALQIGGIWGEFTLAWYKIKGGVRLSLVECPNALAWTITTGYAPKPEAVVVHLTINRTAIKPAFVEEIEEFLSDHSECLNTLFQH
jgi:hypothetical protein